MVYRFNQAPTKGYELHVGARTTHESLNGYWTKAVLDERRGFRWNWRSRDTALVLFEMFEPAAFGWKTKTQIIEKDHWWRQSYVRLRKMYPDRKIISLNPHFVSWSYLQYRELRRRIQREPRGCPGTARLPRSLCIRRGCRANTNSCCVAPQGTSSAATPARSR